MFSLFSRRASASDASSATGLASTSAPSNTHEGTAQGLHWSGPTSSPFGPANLPAPIASLPATKQLVVTTALNHLFTKGYFSVCQLDEIMKLMGAPRHTPARQLLATLHCVDYADMPPELREQLPHLVREAISPQPAVCHATSTALQGAQFS